MKEAGSSRLNSLYEKAHHYNEHVRTKYGKEILSNTVEDVAFVLSKDNSTSLKVLLHFLDPIEISDSCMTIIVNNMMGDVSRSKLAADMRDAIKTKIETKFIEDNIVGGKRVLKSVGIVNNTKEVRMKIISNNKRKKDVQFIMPSDKLVITCAFIFIAIVVHHPYCPIEETRIKLKKHYQIYYSLKDGVSEWVKDRKMKDIEASPWFMPLDSKPEKWVSITEGGYPSGFSRCRFIRSRDKNWELRQPWDFFSSAADAASYIASVPHKVDKWTQDLVEDMYNNRYRFSGFPDWDDIEKRFYSDEEWRNGGKIESRKILVANMNNKKKRMVVATSISRKKKKKDSTLYHRRYHTRMAT